MVNSQARPDYRGLPRSRLLALAIALVFGGQACVGSSRPSPRREPTSTTATPPSWMRGLWTRDWIEVRGVRSSQFAVTYLQTPSLFADMRLPIQRPSFSHAASFADLTDDELLLLAKQRGFTGPVSAVGDTITWQHEIDFQPPNGTPDIGRVQRIGPTQMYEHALDSSYVESWRSVASGDDAFLVVRVEHLGRLEQTLLVAGDYFLYVRNRSVDLPLAWSLDSLIGATHATRAQIVEYLDCEFSTGRVRTGSVPWEIQASTLPWREGHQLAFVNVIARMPDSTHLNVRVGTTEQWSVPINTLSKAMLAAIFPARR